MTELYVDRMRRLVADRDPVEVLQETPARLDAIVSSTDLTRLRQRPGPGKWAPLEVIGHLVDHEVVMAYRLRRVLDEASETMQSYPQEAWVSAQGHNDREPAEFIAIFRPLRGDALRLWNVAEREGLLQQPIDHSSRGEETLSLWRIIHAGHDLAHLDQIARYLAVP